MGVGQVGRDGLAPVFANILHDMSTELALGVAAFVAVMVIFVVMRARGPGRAGKAASSTTAQPFFPPPPKNPPLRPDQIVLRLERQKNREPGPALLLPRRPTEAMPAPSTAPGPDGAPIASGHATPAAPLVGEPAVVASPTAATPPVVERVSRAAPLLASAPQVVTAEPAAPATVAAPELSVELLRHLEWKRFESLVQRYYEAGDVRVTGTAVADGVGIDLELHRGNETQPFSLVHCHACEGRAVQLEAVTSLAAQTAGGAGEVIFVTSGTFSPGAQAFAQTRRMTLITGDTLVARFNALAEKRRGEILEEVMAGDYTTPTCRHCDLKLVLTAVADGKARIWACSRAPRCTFTLPVRLS